MTFLGLLDTLTIPTLHIGVRFGPPIPEVKRSGEGKPPQNPLSLKDLSGGPTKKNGLKGESRSSFTPKVPKTFLAIFLNFASKVSISSQKSQLRIQYKSQSRLANVDQKGSWNMADHEWFIKGKCEKFVALCWDQKNDYNKDILK